MTTTSVTVKSASPSGRAPALAKGLPVTLDFPGKTSQQVTVGDVKNALQAKFPRFSTTRQKLALESSKSALADESALSTLTDLAPTPAVPFVLTVKDLGRQASWRTVFLVEYAGPLVIHPLVYHFPNIFFPTAKPFEHSLIQKVTYGLVLAHFFKRELETVFVHRFSHATMPFFNIFKNSAHYHLLSGVLLAGGIYGPWYSEQRVAGTRLDSVSWLAGWSAVWLVAELLNLSAHITLRNLRPPGTKTRGIPYGGLFGLVSCPNYFAEMIAWAAIAAMTLSPFAFLFLVVSTGQMLAWAVKKHKAYRREFGDKYPRSRKAMIPFIY